jgi:hypothetical protein
MKSHNEGRVTESWIGQDGCEWRAKSVWVGAGWVSYLQKKLANNAWMSMSYPDQTIAECGTKVERRVRHEQRRLKL